MKTGIVFVLIMIAGCAGPLQQEGVDRKGKDQPLVIQLAANGCVEEVLPPTDDNCRDPDATIRAGCSDLKDCACGARGKFVSWRVRSPSEMKPAGGVAPQLPDFSIRFKGKTNPFRQPCRLEANAGGTIRCIIGRDASGDYDYGVKVSSCTEEYDPRIVIRNF